MTSSAARTRTIQNVVFPSDHATETLPLYVDLPQAGAVDILARGRAVFQPGTTASFSTYFNAFPAAYWQKWTIARSVTLRLDTLGTGSITVMRSNQQGEARAAFTRDVSGATASTFDLPVSGFDEGGWYWFDLHAEERLEVTAGSWQVPDAPVTAGKLSIATTTFNKPDYCVATLRTLADSPELLKEIDRIFIIDQGTRKVADEAGFAEVAARLGDQLEIVIQPNLGGSGGFSRGMAETLNRDDSGFVLLLDDDVEIEPESILRAVRFARLCATPTIVGGHMLDLGDRSVLHAFSEVVDLGTFMWGPPDRAHERHDFRESPLRSTPWMHRREDSDFNGWWMCLIPTSVVRRIGLALPVFIKWDDAEYGLRAREAGFPTVSLPGSALWHISWIDKDDTLDWQAYFHARNRLVAALLHSPTPGGGSLLNEYRKQDLKHLLSMQYYPVTLRHQALRDVLAGPGRLHETLPTTLGELRAAAASFPEMRVYAPGTAPTTNEGKRAYLSTDGKGPRGVALLLFTARAALRHLFATPSPENVTRPQLELSKRDATWWRVPALDSALIDSADGKGSSWYTRNPAQFRSLWWQSLRLHRRLARNWDALQRQYREEAAQITSVEAWEKTFRP